MMFSLSSMVSGGCVLMRAPSGSPAQELHDDVRHVRFFGELEDRDDVAVLQLGGGARLAVEPGPHLLGVLGEVGEHQLDRHLPIEHGIETAVEHAHPALTYPGENLIAPDLLELLGFVHRTGSTA